MGELPHGHEDPLVRGREWRGPLPPEWLLSSAGTTAAATIPYQEKDWLLDKCGSCKQHLLRSVRPSRYSLPPRNTGGAPREGLMFEIAAVGGLTTLTVFFWYRWREEKARARAWCEALRFAQQEVARWKAQ